MATDVPEPAVSEPLHVPLTGEALQAYYLKGASKPEDGYYRLSGGQESYRVLCEALASNPEFYHFQLLRERIRLPLERLGTGRISRGKIPAYLRHCATDMVMCVVRGRVDRVTSMATFGQDSGCTLPLETTMPNGC
mgnify:CR=1 FL=1